MEAKNWLEEQLSQPVIFGLSWQVKTPADFDQSAGVFAVVRLNGTR